MFTGLIREFGTVRNFDGEMLSIAAQYRPKIGDSIAVNGACLTVVKVVDGGFSVELSHETAKLIATQNLNGQVHIEPAMQLSDRLEGHIVQGHIDCKGLIEQIEQKGSAKDFYISLPNEYRRFVVPKGSVAVDGVSLTVNDVTSDGFRLTIIPHTLEKSLFGSYQAGREVNIETDMFARYLFAMFSNDKKLDWQTVERFHALF